MKNKVAALSIFLLASAFSAAQAECPKWERLSQSGQKSIEAGDYNKAEQTWAKAVTEAGFCGERDPALPLSLKRLGECYQHNGKYIDAADAFKKSGDQYKIIGTEDSELATDLASLAKSYRVIEFSELTPKVADAFKESGVQLIGLSKLEQGNRFQLNLADKFLKTLDNKDVDQLSLDKLVSFDVVEQPDGSLAINNIKGLKVHAKMWVTIVQSRVQPKNPDGASADVTATKMGITKTVTCKLPSDSVDPMNTLISKLHDFNNGVVTASGSTETTSQTSTSTASTNSASSTASTNSASSAASSPSASSAASSNSASSTVTSDSASSPSASDTTTSATATNGPSNVSETKGAAGSTTTTGSTTSTTETGTNSSTQSKP